VVSSNPLLTNQPMGIWDIYGSEEVKMMDFSKRSDGDFHGISMGFQGFYVVFIQTGVGSEKMVLHHGASPRDLFLRKFQI